MKSGFLGAVAALALSSLPVGATTLTETNITEGGVTPLSAGFVGLANVNANASDGAESYSWGFSAMKGLVGIERSTINPPNGFVNPVVYWSSGEDATGSIFKTASLPEISTSAFAFSHAFAAGETAWFTVKWDDVAKDLSNFDIRISAVPVPPAAMLLFSALAGLGLLKRRRAAS